MPLRHECSVQKMKQGKSYKKSFFDTLLRKNFPDKLSIELIFSSFDDGQIQK